MQIFNFIEKYFWVFFIFSSILALIFPLGGKFLESLLVPLLMIVLFLTCLKIEISEVVEHLKKPVFIFYILLVYLIILPLVIYCIFRFINPELAIGFLLLTAMPPGVASPFLTNLLKGNTGLSLVITVIASLVAPFTVTGLLYFTANTVIQIDTLGVFKTLILVCVLPLIAAQIVRKNSIKLIAKTQSYYSSINTIFVSLILYIAIASQSKEIITDPFSAISNSLILYVLFIFLHIIGYLVAFWRNKRDKIALSITRTYMNNALAIVIAFAFFSPKIALLMVLSELPWSTMPGVFRYVLKYIK